ncbi:MAG TPA: flavodoxin domain-containing protein [Parafilimonas sp.]|nr:flavodoxin domain-containing protein [Parafilimonas sp.]
MLTEQKLQSFKTIIQESSRDEIIWMSGYLAGLSDKNAAGNLPPAETGIAQEKLTISVLYGTETGNSKKVSAKLATALKSKQHKVTISALDQYAVANLEKESLVFIVMSTHGDGEPPEAARKFYNALHEKSLNLENLKYAVLALGDSSYPLFCKAGEDVYAHLQTLNAQPILPLEKADADFYAASEVWITNVLENLPIGAKAKQPIAPKQNTKAGKHFYKGVVTKHINLNDKGSGKETFHIEIKSREGIYYLPGDSLGIVPFNTDEDVDEILSLLSADKSQIIKYKNEDVTLFDLFKYKLSIRYLPLRIVEKYAAITKHELPSVRLDLKNILAIYPITENISLDNLIAILEPITPRLYSISSSPSAHGNNEVHITVGKNKFLVNEKVKYGFCSSHFAGLNEGNEVLFYINTNNNFRLPQHDKDIIMIGPGTGIAPFRSFLFHRDNEGATGRNWLFFGDHHFSTDFLYQSELLSLFDTGSLTKINTAFSRDQAEKLYVQHRMLQQSKELFSWIESGAYLYICGCKDRMAKDVEHTLIEIISKEGSLSEAAAVEYLEQLEEQGRFAKDVY